MNKIKNKKTKNRESGFTLIEILVVIGMIALLAAIVIVAINPARQFAQGRNTQRVSNVNAILNAIGQNIADNKGVFTCATATSGLPTASVTPPITSANDPGTFATPAYKIASSGTNTVDLSCLTPTYIPALPADPGDPANYKWTSNTNYDTGYFVFKDANGRITVYAPKTDLLDGKTELTAVTR
ncbi:MAG: type II secretion system protein [Candidatus Paceibacterota bacterium]